MASQINDQVWDRQRQWELTRDGTLRLMEAHGQLEKAGAEVNRVCGRFPDYSAMHEAVEQWKTRQHTMIDAINFLNFVCWSNETSYALAGYLMELDFVFGTSEDKIAWEIAAKTMILTSRFVELRAAMRNELRLQAKESGFLIKPPSNGPSSIVS